MSATTEQLAVIAVVILIGLPVSIAQVRRARRQESVRERLVRLAHERAEQARTEDPQALDPGPVEQQVSVVLNSYVLSHLYLGDQLARLDRDIREHHTDQGD